MQIANSFVRSRRSPKLPIKEKGLVLVVSLIMVLLMTIVALTSIRGSGLQEAMAGNMRDRSVAFQSCETALRDAEGVLAVGAATLPIFDGTAGYFKDLDKTSSATSVNYWVDNDWKTNGIKSTTTLKAVASPALFVAESLSSDITAASAESGGAVDVAGLPNSLPREFYKISCMGYGVTTDAKVVSQSVWARPIN